MRLVCCLLALSCGGLLGCRAAGVASLPQEPGGGATLRPMDEGDRPFLASVGRDLAHVPDRLWEDGRAVYSSGGNWIALSAAGAYAYAQESFEDREANYFRDHMLLGTTAQDVLGTLGDGAATFGGTLAWYLWALARDDAESYEASKTVFSALAVTGVTTTILKGLISDARPSGSTADFPSGHASQAMAMAASLDGLYGHRVGLPAYALAGLVGLQRLDTGNHDTGAVLFGWTLGYVVGKTVTGRHAPRIFGMDVGVTLDPGSGTVALGLSRSF